MGHSHLQADESGWHQDGRNFWLWSLSSDYLSFYSIEKSHGQDVVRNILGNTFGGVLTSDFYSSYNEIDSRKQRCWVHHLRELRELNEKHKGDKELITFSRRLRQFFHRSVALALSQSIGQDIKRQLNRLEDDTYTFALQTQKHDKRFHLGEQL